MQTPRRQPVPVSSESGSSEATLVGTSSRGEYVKGQDGKKGPSEPIAPFIPPTPASLPQKSQKSEEQRQLERERLANAMKGIQAAHHAVNNAGARPRQNRYTPYAPR